MSVEFAYEGSRKDETGKPRFKKAVAGVLTVALLGGAVGGGYLAGQTTAALAGQPNDGLPAASAPGRAPQTVMAPTSFRELAAKVSPAVVNVATTIEQKAGMELSSGEGSPFPQFPENSPFGEFFKHFFEQMPQGRQGQNPQFRGPQPKAHALGSGFIISPDGYIVTNNHVVDGASEISVTLTDQRKFDAELIGTDPKTDLALLKVKADRDLPYVSFGDSDEALPGDWVVAVGNPFGLGGSVTAGIVSARGRDLRSGPYDDFIQIDAPINKGNSGGPTFNLDGEVIGINTAIYSPNGGSVGIGFDIPANLAKPVIQQLRDHGSVKRGWLGVQIQMVTPEIAEGLGLDKPRGALVVTVTPDSPADQAGFKSGDVILKVGADEVTDMHELPRLVADIESGTDVRFQVLRDGDRQALNVEIGTMPKDQKVASADDGQGTSSETSLGMSLSVLTPAARQQLGIPDDVTGVLVTGVRGDSPAAENGIAPGDIVERIGQEPVTSPEQVAAGIKNAETGDKNSVLVMVNHGGTKRFVALPLTS